MKLMSATYRGLVVSPFCASENEANSRRAHVRASLTMTLPSSAIPRQVLPFAVANPGEHSCEPTARSHPD